MNIHNAITSTPLLYIFSKQEKLRFPAHTCSFIPMELFELRTNLSEILNARKSKHANTFLNVRKPRFTQIYHNAKIFKSGYIFFYANLSQRKKNRSAHIYPNARNSRSVNNLLRYLRNELHVYPS